MPKPDEFSSLTPSAAARFLGVSRQTVYDWIEGKTLRTHHVEGFAVKRLLRADLEVLKRKRDKAGR